MKNETTYIELIERVRMLMIDYDIFIQDEDWTSELERQDKLVKELYWLMTRFHDDAETTEDIGEEE